MNLAHLRAGGALLIIERLLTPAKDGPTSGLMQSLNMLVCTEGKERTLAEYEALLRHQCRWFKLFDDDSQLGRQSRFDVDVTQPRLLTQPLGHRAFIE